MVIKNLYADYSANAIGVVKEISSLTREIMSKYTKQLSGKQITALDTLITSMVDNNLYDKVCDMWLPCLAGNITEALYNIRQNTQGVLPDNEELIYRLNNDGLYGAEYDGNTYDAPKQPLHTISSELSSIKSYFVIFKFGQNSDYIGNFMSTMIKSGTGSAIGTTSSNCFSIDTLPESVIIDSYVLKNLNVPGKGSGNGGIITDNDILTYASAFVNNESVALSRKGTSNISFYPGSSTTQYIRLGTWNISQYNNNISSPVGIELYTNTLTSEEIELMNQILMQFKSQFYN